MDQFCVFYGRLFKSWDDPKNRFSRSRPLQLMEPVFKHFHQKMHFPALLSLFLSFFFICNSWKLQKKFWSFIPNTEAKTIALL